MALPAPILRSAKAVVRIARAAVVGLAVSAASSAMAQNIQGPLGYHEVTRLPVPVVEGDIQDRPYRLLRVIRVRVAPFSVFSAPVSVDKVFKELWERGKRVGADAVINVELSSPSDVSIFKYGRHNTRFARGNAVKFLSDEEIASSPNSDVFDK